MRKQDVPFVGRPFFYILTCSLLSIGYALSLSSEPDIRPGLLEACVGTSLGILGGWVLSRAWLNYLVALTHESKNRSWVGWAAAVAYPIPPFGKAMNYRLLGVVVSFAAFFGTFLILMGLYRLWPNLDWPYARFADATKSCGDLSECAFTAALWSMPSSMVIFMVVNTLSIALATVRWYAGLQD